MSKQGFNEVLVADIGDGTQILNTTTETIVCPDYQFAANDAHIYPGAVFRTTLYADVGTVVTTPGTLIVKLKWGGAGGTALCTSGTMAPSTVALGTQSLMVQFVTVVRTIGSAGSMFTMGHLIWNNFDPTSATTIKNELNMLVVPVSAPAVVGSLDTTTAKLLSVTATFSVATATTQWTNHIRLVECLN